MKQISFLITVFIIGMLAQTSHVNALSPMSPGNCPLAVRGAYKIAGNPAVYYISDECKKRPIRNPAVFFSHFPSWESVVTVSAATLTSIPDHELSFLPWGPRKAFENGSLLKTVNDNEVYLILNNKRFPIATEEVFHGFGFHWQWVEDVTPEVLEKYPRDYTITSLQNYLPGVAFKYTSSPRLYFLTQEGDAWVKQYIPTMSYLNARYRSDRVMTFPDTLSFPDAAATLPIPTPIAPSPLAYSGGACPEIREGENSFQSNGETRRFFVRLPSNPTGAPVIFAWHALGGSGYDAIMWNGLANIYNEEGVILVAPQARDNLSTEWSYTANAANNPDLVFFDDMLACLHAWHQVDLNRIWTTGFSAGGLWSSYLTMHRADRLAAAAIFSGGIVSEQAYRSPAWRIPVLLTWGGPNDTAGTFTFENSSLDFGRSLTDDGHVVIECRGDFGHRPPPDPGYLWRFLKDHPKGASGDLYAGGLPNFFPTWCGEL